MKEVYDFLKKCRTYYLATIDGDKPKVRPFMGKFITTSELVVCTHPKRVNYRRTRQRASKFSNASLSLAAAMSRLSFLPYLFFIPVNGSMYSLILTWSAIWSSSSCFCMYSLIILSFLPTVST